MNNPALIIIVVAVIAILVGAVAGYFAAMVEGRLNKALDNAREVSDPNDPNYVKPLPKINEHEILKITIDPALTWHLELDGVRLESDGLTAEQRTRLVNVVVQIRPWIDGKVVAAPVASAPLPAMSAPKPSISSSAPAPVGMPPISTPPARIDPRRGFRTLLESDVKKPEPLLKNNIVALIDEVLQKKLETSPLAHKKVRLEEGSTGEVVVYVGSARYAGIDAVPDEDIRTIIQQAIKEWNDK